MNSRFVFTRKLHPQKGQSLVEMAITLTVVLTLLSGAFDLGSAFLDYIAMRDAAQEGAIYGSIYRAIPSDSTSVTPIVTRVQQSSTTPVNFAVGFVNSCATDIEKGICVTFSGSGTQCTGDHVNVTVRYTYNLTMPFIGAIIGSQTIPLHTTVSNVILTPACP